MLRSSDHAYFQVGSAIRARFCTLRYVEPGVFGRALCARLAAFGISINLLRGGPRHYIHTAHTTARARVRHKCPLITPSTRGDCLASCIWMDGSSKMASEHERHVQSYLLEYAHVKPFANNALTLKWCMLMSQARQPRKKFMFSYLYYGRIFTRGSTSNIIYW